MKKIFKVCFLILIGCILIGGGTWVYLKFFRASDFTSDPNDDSSTLVLEVPYQNISDNLAFNEGYSSSNSCPWGFTHVGWDFFLKNGSLLLSASYGKVVSVQATENDGVNKYRVVISVRFNSTTTVDYNLEMWTADAAIRDQQLALVKVKVGDMINVSQPLAVFISMESSGHVDFGVVHNNERVCPEPFLSSTARDQMLTMVHSFHPDWNLCY